MGIWAAEGMEGALIDRFQLPRRTRPKQCVVGSSERDHNKTPPARRFSSAKQVIALIGAATKHLYRFVRWELELCLELDLPIIAVNLNQRRWYDAERCPPILRDEYVVHVPFKLAIIKHALDSFPGQHRARQPKACGPLHYSEGVYRRLGILPVGNNSGQSSDLYRKTVPKPLLQSTRAWWPSFASTMPPYVPGRPSLAQSLSSSLQLAHPSPLGSSLSRNLLDLMNESVAERLAPLVLTPPWKK